MHDKGSADRGACIVRRGGYEHIGEAARLPDLLIGHAIERDAAGKAQIVERHLAFEAPDQRQHRCVRGLLQRRCDIGMSRLKLRVHVSRRTQQALHSVRLDRLKAGRLRVDCIILLADANDRLELAAEDLGIAVSCQAHNLRGIVGLEAEIPADHLPDEAERVREFECFELLDTLTGALRQRRAGRFADAVDGEDRRAIEA